MMGGAEERVAKNLCKVVMCGIASCTMSWKKFCMSIMRSAVFILFLVWFVLGDGGRGWCEGGSG